MFGGNGVRGGNLNGATPPSTLVASWPATEGSGSTVANTASGQSGNQLTCVNATWAGADSPLTNAVTLNGTTAYCTSANNTAFNFDSDHAFSVSAWVKTTDANRTAQTIIGTLDSGNNLRGWELTLVNVGTNQAIVYFLLFSNYPSNALLTYQTGSSVNTNVLNHIVVTYPGDKVAANVKIYVNGTLQTTASGGDTLTGATTNSVVAQVGRRLDSTDIFVGNIGITKLYNRVLTATDAGLLYTAPYTELPGDGGGGGLVYSTLTNGQYSAMSNAQYAAITN